MKLQSPEGSQKDRAKYQKLDEQEQQNIRLGMCYQKLEDYQRARFDRIVGSLARDIGINRYQSPREMILIRQIALNTIRIERAELDIMEGKVEAYVSKVETWLIKMQRERCNALKTLSTITKVAKKKARVSSFTVLRDTLRKEERLPKTEQRDLAKDGHDRRYYDDVTRTEE
jgi:hypothetical protein